MTDSRQHRTIYNLQDSAIMQDIKTIQDYPQDSLQHGKLMS
jgi:hypothetical protein